jgi:hypothetical protein
VAASREWYHLASIVSWSILYRAAHRARTSPSIGSACTV